MSIHVYLRTKTDICQRNCICFNVTGTKLLKPGYKLVELVAQAISDSPDGMLQVQQVYTVLQWVGSTIKKKQTGLIYM